MSDEEEQIQQQQDMDAQAQAESEASNKEPVIKKGWGLPRSTKYHYFEDGMSLCRKYGFYNSTLEDDNHNSPDNCKQCMKLRDKKYGVTLPTPVEAAEIKNL